MATLSVLIGGDDRELQAALRRAQSGMRKLGSEMRDGINTAAKYGAAAVAAGAALATHLVKEQFAAIDASAKLAAALYSTVAGMAAAERAAELSGIKFETLQTGARKLASVLGEAAQGTGTAVKSLERLHLTSEQLAALPLDERLALINERIREFIPINERAAVSADFFGERAGVAMLNLSPETIRQAAEETRLFGTALSDVDANKVEQANDSFSRIGLGIEGFTKQIAVRLAPIVSRIGEEFAKATKEAGGMEVVAEKAFAKIVTAAGFAADAADGVRRVFVIAADAIIIASAKAEAAVRQLFAVQLKAAQVATLGLSETVKRWSNENAEAMKLADGVAREAWGNIQKTLEAPLPSTALEKFVSDVQAAGQKAAESAVNARKDLLDDAPDGGGKQDEAAMRRLEKLKEQFASEDELVMAWREKQLEDIAEFEEKKLIGQDEANALREEVELAHWERIGEIRQRANDKAVALERAKNAALQAAQNNFFNNLAGLMNTQSRKLFEVGKVAAIAQAGVKTHLAVIEAWEAGMSTGGPWAPFVAAAYAAAAAINGANLINNIRSQEFGGGGSTPRAPSQGASNISPQGAGGGSTSTGGTSEPATILHLYGDTFGADQIRDLFGKINEERKNGGRFILA